MKRRIKIDAKNIILIAITGMVALIGIFAGCCLDSFSWAWGIVGAVALGYLSLFFFANREWLAIYEDSRWEK